MYSLVGDFGHCIRRCVVLSCLEGSRERTPISRKRKFTRWPSHTDATGSYNLDRVHPFNFIHQLAQTAIYPALAVQIRVGFSHHTFTDPNPSVRIVTIELGLREAAVLVANGVETTAAEQQVVRTEQTSVSTSHYDGSPAACRDLRFFSIERYELANQLRDIVERKLPLRQCYFAKRENYFVVEANSTPSKEYRVFFDVRHIDGASDSVLLFVQSAYLADRSTAPGGKRKKVGFNVLVNCALKATRAVEPP